ncbi:MAG: AAA family ATPase [Anaerolineae bacterium]
MPLGDRLSAARRRQFVGRSNELTVFRSALDADELPFQILFVYGPGGVGKTTLLNEFTHRCADVQAQTIYLDARTIDPTPEAFVGMLRRLLNLGPTESPLEILRAETHRRVLFVDTFELLLPLDVWLRESFLPELPENLLVVFAGREPPSAAWLADAGWQSLIRTVPLRNLSPDESRTYLSKRNVPVDQHPAVLNFTHGFPLALSLVAEVFAQRQDMLREFQPETSPDIVKALLERFVQKVPSPAHRATLEACALVRVTTEALLGEMLMMSDSVHDLFEWLRGLSFIEARADGLSPHDLAREALVADLRWRNPDWYKELHKRARNYYSTRVRQTHGLDQQRLLYDFVFLHRDNAVIRSMLEWQTGSSQIVADGLRETDRAVLIEMVEQHEGPESARYATDWLARQPEGVTVYRDEAGGIVGFIAMIALQRASADDLNSDPATRLAWEYVQRHAPLRAGEVATHYRFWMAAQTYQAVSPVQTQIFLTTVRYQLATPGLVYHFLPCANPDMWAGAFAYANLTRLTEIDYATDGKTYGVYAHDWRSEPPLAWLELLAEREVAGGQAATPPVRATPLIVLSETEFAGAVRDALRDFAQPDLLTANPLLRSRVVVDRAGAGSDVKQRVTVLQSLIKAATETLQSSPRDARLFRAVYHTYLKPAPTQEQAAELLDLPFSTYRRHLKSGITRLTEMLWQQEIGA